MIKMGSLRLWPTFLFHVLEVAVVPVHDELLGHGTLGILGALATRATGLCATEDLFVRVCVIFDGSLSPEP